MGLLSTQNKESTLWIMSLIQATVDVSRTDEQYVIKIHDIAPNMTDVNVVTNDFCLFQILINYVQY